MEWLAPEPLMSASMAHGDPEKRVGKRRRRSVEVKVFGTWGTHTYSVEGKRRIQLTGGTHLFAEEGGIPKIFGSGE